MLFSVVLVRPTHVSLKPRRIPSLRIRSLNDKTVQEGGDYVVYWMTTARRRKYNFALQRAVRVAAKLDRPLVIFEALRVDYPWANDRLHLFIMQGMVDNARSFEDAPVSYYPWIERAKGEGKGLLRTLARRACMVVTDDYPAFFIPKMLDAAGRTLSVRLEAVDSNGLLPMRQAERTFLRAHDFRRFIQKNLAPHLSTEGMPEPDPLKDLSLPLLSSLPKDIQKKWPPVPIETLSDPNLPGCIPIDHSVAPVSLRGGGQAADRRWKEFTQTGLKLYANGRNHPDDDLSSGLSPWLHFGHVGVHDIFSRIVDGQQWSIEQLGHPNGQREGWWKLDAGREAFLDELITWRELGFNMASREENYTDFESLPAWALETLYAHKEDARPYIYDLSLFKKAETHDELWNAAQRQLLSEGRIHNYLRMLWGKKILHWSKSPQEALAIMVELNNRYALDGRDPNSYSGIFWILGRYDRAWGPEREVFGKVRYMTSDSTKKKLRVRRYLAKWSV